MQANLVQEQRMALIISLFFGEIHEWVNVERIKTCNSQNDEGPYNSSANGLYETITWMKSGSLVTLLRCCQRLRSERVMKAGSSNLACISEASFQHRKKKVVFSWCSQKTLALLYSAADINCWNEYNSRTQSAYLIITKGTWAKPRSFSGIYPVLSVFNHLEKTLFQLMQQQENMLNVHKQQKASMHHNQLKTTSQTDLQIRSSNSQVNSFKKWNSCNWNHHP